ncbi:MAG: phenylalanine--tRNA ligase subunit beta [Conexivisphaerales archaeon]
MTRKRLERIYPKRNYDSIISMLPFLGLDIEDLTEEYVKVEYSPNRPDFSTDIGIIRGLKGLFGDELGIKRRNFEAGKVEINVDYSVSSVRPFIAGFLALDLSLDEDSIKQIISMQEDLHRGIGRERKKVAIGFHDFSAIIPPISYTTVNRDFTFVPLNGVTSMPVKEILVKTEQGLKYAPLVTGTRFPALIDSNGTVLSLPPIINGNATKVKENTKNVFVDITGTDREAVKLSASIIAETLWDMGARIVRGIVNFQEQRLSYPEISLNEIKIDRRQINRMLGFDISQDQLLLSLLKSRLEPTVNNDEVKVSIPHYRDDIMHPVDLVEEVMIGFGLFNIQPDTRFFFNATPQYNRAIINAVIRQVLVGLGFSEAVNPILTSEMLLIKFMKRKTKVYSVSFSKSLEHNVMRDMLLPGCIKVVSINQQESAPHKFFEIGDIIAVDGDIPKQEERLCIVEEGQDITMTSAKSYIEAVNSIVFKHRLVYANTERPYSLRAAIITSNGKAVGEIGEVHPDILTTFKIKNPVIYGEFYL